VVAMAASSQIPDEAVLTTGSRSAAMIGLAFAQVEPTTNIHCRHAGLMIRLSRPTDRTRAGNLGARCVVAVMIGARRGRVSER
jgi:hypothetical protein